MYKPTLHSNTITHGWFIFKGVREPKAVCQAAPANTINQAWQRVCLSHRTTKPTDKLTDEEEHRTDNKRFGTRRGVCPQKVLSDFQAFTPARTFVFPRPAPSRRPSNCLKTPLHY